MISLKPTIHTGMLALILCATFTAEVTEAAEVLKEWRFNESVQWNGWHPHSGIHNVVFESDASSFDTGGNDPQVLSPLFELAYADNQQWVEIEFECSSAGHGELFYTNSAEGRYGGLCPEWMSVLSHPGEGEQK